MTALLLLGAGQDPRDFPIDDFPIESLLVTPVPPGGTQGGVFNGSIVNDEMTNSCQDPSPVRRDLDGLEADYLVVCPPAFTAALEPLCSHRARTYRVAVVRTDDVAARHGKGVEGIRKLVGEVKPRFLLLAGDTDQVPTFVQDASYTSERFMSDPNLATDHGFGAVTGRLPADTAEELRAMGLKTVEYESSLKPGPWQRKINFVTGEGGFGELVDAILEKQFKTIVARHIPAAYDVEIAYAKPSSPFCVFPPKFNEHTIRLLNEGSLFTAYVGHGLRTSFDDIRYKGESYPILESKDARKVDVRAGLPVMVVIACDTGKFDETVGDCIGEDLLRRPKGPVAFIGGSRVTQPYGNSLLGHKIVEGVFAPLTRTLGEALWAAKAAVLAPDDSALRRQADLLAGTVQGAANLEKMRKDVVLHYNLLGDPALVLRRLDGEIALDARGTPRPGGSLTAAGRLEGGGRVRVTLECGRDAFFHPTDMVGDSLEERLARRYANANNRVVAEAEVEAKNGAFEADLRLPEGLKPGIYHLKASTAGALGAREIEIKE